MPLKSGCKNRNIFQNYQICKHLIVNKVGIFLKLSPVLSFCLICIFNNQLIIIMQKNIFFLIIVSLFITASCYAQQEVNTIVLNNFLIEVDGNQVEFDTVFTYKVQKDHMLNKIIFDNGDIKYGVEFTYKFKGRRVKLTRRTYALLSDGKMVYSKRKKDMQELKVSVPGIIAGVSAESILYNKATMGSIFVSFKYNFKYKE